MPDRANDKEPSFLPSSNVPSSVDVYYSGEKSSITPGTRGPGPNEESEILRLIPSSLHLRFVLRGDAKGGREMGWVESQ